MNCDEAKLYADLRAEGLSPQEAAEVVEEIMPVKASTLYENAMAALLVLAGALLCIALTMGGL